MKKIFCISILIFTMSTVNSQSLPDSIVVIYSQYAPEWFDKGTVYQRDTMSIVKKKDKYILYNKEIDFHKIKSLYQEIKNPLSLSESFYQSGIDTSIIKNKSLKLKKNYKEQKYDWNDSQQLYISSELSNIDNYVKQYEKYLNPYNGVSIPPYYENNFMIKCFRDNVLTDELISNKSKPFRLYQFPWVNLISNTKYYNVKLGEILLDIVGMKNPSGKLLKGTKLLNYLSGEVVESKGKQLLEFAANTYQNEINELKENFTIISAREKTTYGGYIGDGGIIVVILHNEKMQPNVYVSLGLSKQRKTLYSRDSIKTDYQDIVERVQSITFINNYLEENLSRKLYIHYFNNRPINDYIYNQASACIARQFQEAITFELINEDDDTSLWLLLPDNSVLLFRMNGEKVLNFPYTDFGSNKGNLYPCLRLDEAGNVLSNLPIN